MIRIKTTLAGLFMLCALGMQAQLKIAHLNQSDLLDAMDKETKPIQDSLKQEVVRWENELKFLLEEIEQKENELTGLINNGTVPEVLIESKRDWLITLQMNYQQYQSRAQDSLAALQDRLMAPIFAKIKKAIDEVCLEKGYNYVFDTSMGNPIFTDPKLDILADVKRKLGLIP